MTTRDGGSAAATRRGILKGFRSLSMSWVDVAWVVFVGLNLLAMRIVPEWQTIPFLAIWVSLTAIYGARIWRLQPTIVTVVALMLATGGVIGVQVLRGTEDPEYLVEVPLIALMFLVMVWQGRRRLVAMQQMRRAADRNARLLEEQRQFLQDASHELRTPITVALGHTELIERAAADPQIERDAHVIEDELMRLRGLANRLLLLASAETPDFLHVVPVNVTSLLSDSLDRWKHVSRQWSLSANGPAIVVADVERLGVALDSLISNAVAHTTSGDCIELGVRVDGPDVVLAVRDTGAGIADGDLERIFNRFARVDSHRSRASGGFGLGLPIVKAVAEAHGGSVRARSAFGQGSVFEIVLPAASLRETEGADEQPSRGEPSLSQS